MTVITYHEYDEGNTCGTELTGSVELGDTDVVFTMMITFDKPLANESELTLAFSPNTGCVAGAGGKVTVGTQNPFCTIVTCTEAKTYTFASIASDSYTFSLGTVISQIVVSYQAQAITAQSIDYYDDQCITLWESPIMLNNDGDTLAYAQITFDKVPHEGKLNGVCSDNGKCSFAETDLDGTKAVFCAKLIFTDVGQFTIKSLRSDVLTDTFTIASGVLNNIVVEKEENPKPENNFKPSGVKYHNKNDCSSEISGKLTLSDGKASAYAKITFVKELSSGDTVIGKCGSNCEASDVALNSNTKILCMKLDFSAAGSYKITELKFKDENSREIDVSLL
ncbi:MAG: hypothetical protein ACRC42_00670, partial [Mycoplasma sp.]